MYDGDDGKSLLQDFFHIIKSSSILEDYDALKDLEEEIFHCFRWDSTTLSAMNM